MKSQFLIQERSDEKVDIWGVIKSGECSGSKAFSTRGEAERAMFWSCYCNFFSILGEICTKKETKILQLEENFKLFENLFFYEFFFLSCFIEHISPPPLPPKVGTNHS
jgi:hypothetical protein